VIILKFEEKSLAIAIKQKNRIAIKRKRYTSCFTNRDCFMPYLYWDSIWASTNENRLVKA